MKKTTLSKIKILLFLFLCFGTTFNVSAQNDYYSVITGTSTSGNGRAPQAGRSVSRSVWLLTAAEMTTSGFVNGETISGIGFTFQTAQDIPTTGTIVVYLQNTADATNTKSTTWATAITGMITASNGSMTMPNTAGEFNYVFTTGTPFVYSGGALYVAFDYQNTGTLSSTTNVALCNTALTNGLKGAVTAAGVTTPPVSITASNFRPETRLAKPVSCARPTNLSVNTASTTLNSAVLTWNPVGGSNIELEYGVYDFTQGTGGTILTSVTSPHSLTGLTDSNVYDYYIRTNCGTGSYSLWNGPYSFNTLFSAANAPYNTSFEQETLPFVGWSTPNAIPIAGDWGIGNYGVGALVQNGVSSVASVTPAAAAANNWMFSRGINLVASNLVTITYYISNYQASSTATGNYKLTVGNAQTIASQTQVLGTESGLNAAAFTLKTFTFTPTTDGVYYFGLHNFTPLNAAGTHALIVDNFSVSQVLSNDKFELTGLSVYPNPVNNSFTIENSNNISINSLSISDINGRTVKTINKNSIENIDISDLNSGVYFLNITSDKGSVTKKLIKN